MANLRHLSISGMDCDYGDNTKLLDVKRITERNSQLKNLRTFSLTMAAMQTLPNELSELRNLKVLDLTDNTGISNIAPLTQIHGLEYLYLYGCGLTKLPDQRLKKFKGNWICWQSYKQNRTEQNEKGIAKLYCKILRKTN